MHPIFHGHAEHPPSRFKGEVHQCPLPIVELHRVDLSLQHKTRGSELDVQGATPNCGEKEYSEGEQEILTKPCPQDSQGESCTDSSPASGRRHQPVVRVPGTGTVAMTCSSTSATLVPLICASGRTMSLWLRTGDRTDLTSSGLA